MGYTSYAALDNIVTDKKEGYVLMRFVCKGFAFDLMFKPEDVAIYSDLTDINNPISVKSIEEGLKLIADAADKKGI